MEEIIKCDEIVNRWEEIGFTEGLNGKDKEELSVKFDRLAKFLCDNEDYGATVFTDDEHEILEPLNTVAFAVMRRAFCGEHGDSALLDDPKGLCDFIIAHFEDDDEVAKCSGEEDPTAFLCGTCADRIR